MMIPGILAQRRLTAGPPAGPASLVGTVATASTFTGNNFTVSVPGGAQAGDTLIAVLRCRADRSFTVPAGWATETDATVGTAGVPATDTRLYILHKGYAGETSLTFVQNASAAGLFALIVVRGSVGGISKANNANATNLAPVNPDSMLLALGTASAVNITNPTWAALFAPPAATYRWAASVPHFYCVTAAKYSSGGTSSVAASYTWSADNGSNYIWLAEILPPS